MEAIRENFKNAKYKLEEANASLKEIRNQTSKVVIVATDASENTKKKISDKCIYYQIPFIIHFTRSELSQAIGKERTICTVTNNGFGKKFRELLSI